MIKEESALEELANEPTTPVVDIPEPESQEEAKQQAKRRLSDRNRELTKNWRETQRELAEVKTQLNQFREQTVIKSEPDPKDYEDLDKYRETRDKWISQEREKIRHEEREAIKNEFKQEEENTRFQESVESYKKAAEKLKVEDPNFQTYAQEIDRAIADWDAPEIKGIIYKAKSTGPAIVQYLGTHPEELEDIASSSPFDRVLKMGQLMSQLKATSIKTSSSAPNPTRSEVGSAPSRFVHSGGTHSTVVRNETFAERARRINGR